MSLLEKLFDKSVNQSSPVQKDFARVVNYDSDGNEIITYEEIDYKSIQESHGTVDLWNLDSLLKAGINPNFPIHTSNPTRLDGLGAVSDAAAYAETLLQEIEGKPEDLPKV